MSFVRRPFRKILLFAGVFLVMVVVVGCQQAGKGVSSALVTPQGLKAEAFLPQDSFVVFQAGAANQAQADAFANLLKHFPVDDQSAFQKKLVEGFDKDLSAYGLGYEQDILPIVGKNLQILVALQGTPLHQEKPFVYAFIPLVDPSRLDGVFGKLVQGGSFQKEHYGALDIISRSSGEEYMVRVGDLLVVSNDLASLKSSLDRQQSSQQSLLQDAAYQRALGQLKPSVAFAYINLQGIFNVIRQDPQARAGFEKLFAQVPTTGSTDAYQGEMFSVQAEEKGLRLYGAVYGDEAKMKAMEQNFSNLPSHEPYLYKKVPGGAVDLYMEGYNLKKVLDYDFNIWSGIDGFSQGLEKVKQGFSAVGLDFDKDFMSLFEQGVALSVHNNGTVLPSVGLYADVEKRSQEAGKVMERLKTMIDVLLARMASTRKDSPDLLTNQEVTVSDGKAYVVRLNLDKVDPSNPNFATLRLFLTKPVEFWYGVTGDKLAFLALEPGFDQIYVSSPKVQDDSGFQRVTAQLQSLESGVVYISPAAFVGYFDKIFDLASLGSASARSNTAEYGKIKAYFKPLTGAAFTTVSVSAGEAHFQGFVLID